MRYGDIMGNGHGGGDGGDSYRKAHKDFAAGANDAGGVGLEIQYNPAVSEKQRRLMGADLARAQRAGKKTRTGMSEAQLRDYARK